MGGMKSQKVSGGYVLVLRKGEPLVRTIAEFCSQHQITAGWLSGIGAVRGAEIGYYDLEDKNYHFQQLDGLYEVLNLSGNVSKWRDQIILHLHIELADRRLQSRGGHLKEAEVGGTVEIYLQIFDQPLTRAEDADTGLKLIQ